MANQICLVPTGGLCNRMRAFASGVNISQKMNVPITVMWNKYYGLNAKFEELFCPVETPNVTVVENTNWFLKVNNTKDYYTRWLFLRKYGQVIYNFSDQNSGDIFKRIHSANNKELLLISCFSMSELYDLKKLFAPVPKIQKEIEAITNNYSPYTIGVHIRRTDNIDSIKSSSLESFINMMQTEIKNNPTVTFYLATDDEIIKQDIKQKFPDRIITYDAKVERDSLKGMEASVVELFCLSRTNKIIGSNYSSYSQIAAKIGGIPLVYA